MMDSNARSSFYAGLIRELAEPIDPECFFCLGCGNQHHECACDDLAPYQGSDPSLYRENHNGNRR
jgi:hypothetical protein